jgi:valyl-tRNA synthetase
VKEYLATIIFLCSSADDVRILGEGLTPEGDSNVTVIVPGTPVEAFLDLEGMIDFEKEIGTLTKKIANLDKTIAAIKKKQGESTYHAKVPEAIQADDTQKLAAAEDERSKADVAVQNMRAIQERQKK